MKKITLVFLFLCVTAGGAETGKTVSAKPLSAPVMDARVVNGQKACNPETIFSSMDDHSEPPILNYAPAPQVEVAQLAGTQPMSPQRAATPPTVLSNLAVRCGHLGSQPASGRFTVWDLPSGTAMLNASSGTSTGLAVTIGNTAANADKTILDTQHTFAYAAGDMLRIQFTTEANETLGDCTASFNY